MEVIARARFYDDLEFANRIRGIPTQQCCSSSLTPTDCFITRPNLEPAGTLSHRGSMPRTRLGAWQRAHSRATGAKLALGV